MEAQEMELMELKMNPLFKVGDNAVYPAHGVTIVKRIDEREVAGRKKSFYVLQVVENQMTIMVPTDNAKQVGLREIIPEKEVKKVYGILKERNIKIDQTTWNRRYREYMEKIRTGSVYEIAEVLRNLFLLRHSKDLSFGERKMLDQAKALLVRELSLARKTDELTIETEIQTIFAG
jgi:CarD family transcriptional regulator